MILTRGFGSTGGLITQGFSTAVEAIVEEAKRKRRRGRRAIREFEDYLINVALVAINGKKPSKEISNTYAGSVIIEDNRAVRASGVEVNYVNSPDERIVITASRVSNSKKVSLTRRKPGTKPDVRISIDRILKGQ